MSEGNSNIPIPKEFYNSETKKPFEACLMCHKPLAGGQYLIEKAIKNYPSLGTTEIIFEYAMCIPCASKMHLELSSESRSRIENYMAEHLGNKRKQDIPRDQKDIGSSLTRCLVKETELSQSSEYSIYALCNGSEMVVSELPYALSGEVQDEIMQLLSAKSLDIMDDFIGNHFTGPPEVKEILRRRPVFI